MSHAAIAIANEFIKLANANGKSLTHMQLQKLVYLAHGWNLAVHNRPLIEDQVEAWQYGTVIRRLYEALKKYKAQPVSELINWGDDIPCLEKNSGVASVELSLSERELLEKVWEVYGSFPAFKLSAITHDKNGPWHKHFESRMDNVIPDADIKRYFIDLVSSQNTASAV